MIAMALSCDPELLIADEPTTALDVTIQAQILKLLGDIKAHTGGLILITHNLAIIKDICDRVVIMYAGKIVEWGDVHQVMYLPMHPYTKGLLDAIPRLNNQDKRLRYIPGNIPSAIDPPSGCRFSPRCMVAVPICFEQEPPMCEKVPGHFVACYVIRKERGI